MWEIQKLEGKYYGTIIEHSETGDAVKVWFGIYDNTYRASDRELANGWESDVGYDHVELQSSYEAALKIVDALNGEVK